MQLYKRKTNNSKFHGKCNGSKHRFDAVVQRKTNTTVSFLVNIMVQNIDFKVKEVAIVIIVVPVTLQSIVQLTEKFVTIVIRRDTSSLFVGVKPK